MKSAEILTFLTIYGRLGAGVYADESAPMNLVMVVGAFWQNRAQKMLKLKDFMKTMAPFLCLSLFIGALTWPLWHRGDLVFARVLEGEPLTAAWYIQWAASHFFEGGLPDGFRGFDYPCYLDRVTIPDVWNAYIAAPLNALFEWPQVWGAQQAFAILLSALGAGVLARAVGARHMGIVFAGGIFGALPLIWHELREGYLNAAWPGFALAALGAFILLTRGAGEPSTSKPKSAFFVVMASLLGALALGTYPIYVLAAVPMGLVFIWPHFWHAPARVLLHLMPALAVGLALAWPYLQAMLTFQSDIYPHWPCESGAVPCPSSVNGLYYSTLAVLRPGQGHGVFDVSSVGMGAWVLAPLMVLSTRLRGQGIVLLAYLGILITIALGPCPEMSPPTRLDIPLPFRTIESSLGSFWCWMGQSRVFHRYIMMAVGLSAVMGGLGLEGLWQRGQAFYRALALGAMLLALAQVSWILRVDLDARHQGEWRQWDGAGATLVGTYLKDLPPGVVAELPFDYDLQFHSANEAPQHLRLNPFKPDALTPTDNAFVMWLKALGHGPVLPADGGMDSLSASGVNWVIFDPARCGGSRYPDAQSCAQALPQALQDALGEPQRLEGGLLIWDLSPHLQDGAAAALEAQCPGPISIVDARGDQGRQGPPLPHSFTGGGEAPGAPQHPGASAAQRGPPQHGLPAPGHGQNGPPQHAAPDPGEGKNSSPLPHSFKGEGGAPPRSDSP